MKDMLLSLADELEGMDVREGCRTCPADGTKDCRGDLSCEEAVARAVARRVREIVEHDECEVTTVSAYDLLPEDEREAIAWVREHGGLETVKASAHQGAMEHGYLLKIAHTLGTSIYDGTDNADALLEKLSERLMPEGMEWLIESWPRFDANEPLRWDDEYVNGNGGVSPLRHVSLYADGRAMLGKGKVKVVLAPGERAKRPAPKVVDADGVEIRVGDTVWFADGSLEDYDPHIVESVNADPRLLRIETIKLKGCNYPFPASSFTHRAPVLAADGKPLKEGDKVWSTAGEFDGERTVKDVCKDPDEQSYAMFEERGEPWSCLCCLLAHEQPDTWERLEHDAEKTVCEYLCANYDCANCPFESARCAEEVKKDIIRRAKKLAERGGR